MKRKRTPRNEVRWPSRVTTLAEARKFIDATGFCMLFPVNNVPLPSLYCAVTRREPERRHRLRQAVPKGSGAGRTNSRAAVAPSTQSISAPVAL